MKITDALLGEHAVIYALFSHLEGTIPTDSLAELKSQGALLAAALASHAGLEEELLFSKLEPHIGPSGPLAVMRYEHETIEGSLERLPSLEEVGAVRKSLMEVISVARAHFAKEEQVLFPLAASTLTSEALEDLGDRWASRRVVPVA